MQVNVVPSIVKNKLYIGQMPRDVTREEVEGVLKQEVVGERRGGGGSAAARLRCICGGVKGDREGDPVLCLARQVFEGCCKRYFQKSLLRGSHHDHMSVLS